MRGGEAEETNNNHEEEVASCTEEQAQELRAALDEQLETVRSLSLEDLLSEEWSVDEQLARFVVLVSAYPNDALKRAVLMTHPAATTNGGEVQDGDSTSFGATYSGRLPIHLACDTNAPIEIIRWLLENDENKESIKRVDRWGDLPLHTACSRKNVEVVRLLLENDQDKTSIFTKDDSGSLPIHMACRYNSPAEVFKILLEGDTKRTSLFEPGMFEQLPIHIACRCNLAPDSIQHLLDYDTEKKTLLVEDSAGRLPLHVAYLRNSHNQVIQILLEGMICHRIERIGLDLWKRDMSKYLKSMNVHERDFNTSDKLEMTRTALTKFMERAYQLELAVWKARCLIPDCKTLQEVADKLRVDDPSFDVNEYKKEQRIMSGAEVIVPGVLSFLEDEPIVELLAQFV